MWNNTYRNWSTSQKVKIIIFAKQIHILVIGLKPLTAHNKITSKIFPCKINTTENKTKNSAKQNKSRSKTRNVMAHGSKLRLFWRKFNESLYHSRRPVLQFSQRPN